MLQFRYTQCAECGHPIEKSWSRYCTKHFMRSVRYGGPHGRRLMDSELKDYKDLIGRALAARHDSDPVKAALELVEDEILNYQSTHGFTVQLRIQEQMQRLREGGVTPHQLLLTVCSVFALELIEETRFYSPRECNFTVARQVLKMRNMHGFRPDAAILSWLGGMLRDWLGLFAYQLAREAMKVDATKTKRRRRMACGW